VQSTPPSVYTDFQGIAALKHQARNDQQGSLDLVARQFESLFVQMMVKQMRQASFGGGILDSDRTRQYQEMYDQQLALHLAECGGIGLSEVLKRQLGKEPDDQIGQLDGMAQYRNSPVLRAAPNPSVESSAPLELSSSSEINEEQQTGAIDSPEEFVRCLWPAAQQAAQTLGLPPEALLAQAALETGWGRHVMSADSGLTSHNLFGIKADRSWNGAHVRRDTLEYEDGVAIRKRESFRAYHSYEESFHDYVEFLQNRPRYAKALANTHDSQAYFSALQEAGYATDPSYAQKILRVMQGPEMQDALSEIKDVPQQAI
jgi:flagellar protein FlgJ